MIELYYKCKICNIEIIGFWPRDENDMKSAVKSHDRSHEIKNVKYVTHEKSHKSHEITNNT